MRSISFKRTFFIGVWLLAFGILPVNVIHAQDDLTLETFTDQQYVGENLSFSYSDNLTIVEEPERQFFADLAGFIEVVYLDDSDGILNVNLALMESYEQAEGQINASANLSVLDARILSSNYDLQINGRKAAFIDLVTNDTQTVIVLSAVQLESGEGIASVSTIRTNGLTGNDISGYVSNALSIIISANTTRSLDALDDVVDPNASATITTLATGEVVEGQITSDQGQVWEFEAQSGNIFEYTVETTAFSPQIQLFAPSGGKIFDYYANDTQLSVVYTALQETGVYRLLVLPFSSGVKGSYQLSVEPISANMVKLGETYEGQVTPENHAYILFEASAGDQVDIEVIGDFSITWAFNLLYETLRYYSGRSFILPYTGTYLVEIYPTSQGSHDYSITVNRSGEFTSGKSISYNESIVEDLGSTTRYSFEGQAGDIVTITVKGHSQTMGEFGIPDIFLHGIYGELLAVGEVVNADTPENTIKQIETFKLPADGVYNFLVLEPPVGYTVELDTSN